MTKQPRLENQNRLVAVYGGSFHELAPDQRVTRCGFVLSERLSLAEAYRRGLHPCHHCNQDTL